MWSKPNEMFFADQIFVHKNLNFIMQWFFPTNYSSVKIIFLVLFLLDFDTIISRKMPIDFDDLIKEWLYTTLDTKSFQNNLNLKYRYSYIILKH